MHRLLQRRLPLLVHVGVLLVMLGVSGSIGVHRAEAQSTYGVNATGDAGDANVGDGVCATGATTPGGAAECTLRAALDEANNSAACDTLRFDTVPRNASGMARFVPATPLAATHPVVLDGTTAPRGSVVEKGDLRRRIAAIQDDMPPAGSNGFVVPTPTERRDWKRLIGVLLEGEIQAARSIIEQQFPSYALIRFTDTGTDQTVWLLQERPPVERGWGAVAVNPAAARNLVVEVPHPVFDLDTHTQGADLFRETGARVLLLAGTARCANEAPSPCDGQSGVCGAFGPYRVSDMAHVTDAPFQAAHEVLTDRYPEATVLNLHGNGNSSCETVFLSDGVANETSAAVEDLRQALQDRGVGAGHPGTSTCPLEGTTNVQGRHTNGSTVPCTEPATSSAGTFIHVEQRRGFRGSPERYRALIEALKEVVPASSAAQPRSGTTIQDLRAVHGSEAPVVVVDGELLATGDHGLVLSGPDAAGSVVTGLAFIHAPASGLLVQTPGVRVAQNYVGLHPDGAAAPNGRDPGADPTVAALDVDGEAVVVEANVVSGNQSAGVRVRGDDGVVSQNILGTGPALQEARPNQGPGIVVDGAQTVLTGNIVFGSGGSGIRVAGGPAQIGYGYAEAIAGDPSPLAGGMGNIIAQSDSIGIVIADTTGTAVRGNSIFGNGIAGLRIDGPYDGNDEGDTDEGINRGQNVPVIASVAGCDDSGSTTTVDVSYQVRSNADSANASNYGDEGLKVDFYTTDSGEDQGRTYLGTDAYAAADAGSVVTTTLSAEGVSCSDAFVATATDANNNTSQFNTSTVLPVELASFAGQQIDETSVELVWQTATEQNNAGFRVEQSAQGGDWTQVAFVDGAGTTTEAQTYRLAVEDLEPGTHRFRLTQVDVDGSAQTFDAVTVRLGMQEALRVTAPSPNPVRTGATMRFAVKQSAETTVSVYNVLGQRVATLYQGTPTAEETKAVDVSADGLPSGAYFLRVTSGEHTETRRFTVVR